MPVTTLQCRVGSEGAGHDEIDLGADIAAIIWIDAVTSCGARRATGGYGINPNNGSYVGSEVDLIVTCALRPYATLQGGYGHFFVGDYVKSSLAPTGGATDADYLYGQFTFNF